MEGEGDLPVEVLVKDTLATDVVAKRDDHPESMTGALWSWISAESKNYI